MTERRGGETDTTEVYESAAARMEKTEVMVTMNLTAVCTAIVQKHPDTLESELKSLFEARSVSLIG